MSPELLAKLKKLAERQCWMDADDFSPYDFSGGNSDDAWAGGYADGQAKLAREILKELELPEEPPF